MSGRMPATAKDIRLELDVLSAQLKPLLLRQGELEGALRRAVSREKVAELGISIEDVVLSSGEGVPWFYRDNLFVQWIRSNGLTHKPWVEWNGSVYPMQQFLVGKLCYENGNIMLEDVKGYKR